MSVAHHPRRQPALLLSHAHRHHFFDIALNLTAPNGLLFMLNVHPERQHEVVCGDAFTVQPGLPITEFRDVIGNRCARIAVPAGVQEMRVSNRATVRDSGPGIAEAELPQVLQPFHRLEASRNRSTGGVGLGLAIAHDIARQHRGTLEIHNPVPTGLVATLTLPC
jgi:hypothetical protein